MRSPALTLLPALALTLFATHDFGGWAVVSVDDPPEHAVVGKPLTFTFMVRQHGVTPRDDLHPTLRALGAGSVDASATSEGSGRYRATLTLPAAGTWTLTIDSGWGASALTLLPMQAIAPGAATPAALAGGARGRHLFVAKGCVSCHVHDDVPAQGEVKIGPELTGRRFPAEYLTKFLANPDAYPPRGRARMPNLGLRQPEIVALVAFINGEGQVSRR